MSNIINQTPYLRTTRFLPKDLDLMRVQLDKSYVEISNSVNARIIGIFSVNRASITGSSWYLSGTDKQQTLRQVYTFTAAGNIAHGIQNLQPGQVLPSSYGSYTDGTNTFGVLFSSSVAIAGQVSFYVTSTNIVVLVDAGAPAPTSGYIVLEWLPNT